MSDARYLKRKNNRLYKRLKPSLELLITETKRMILKYPKGSAIIPATIELCNDRWIQICKNNNVKQLINLYIVNINNIKK